MASINYNSFFKKVLEGDIDLVADTINVLLVDDTYTESKAHDFVEDVSGDELSGTGYTRKTLSGKSVTIDTDNNRIYFDATDPVWTGLDAGVIGGAVVFKQVTNDADSPVICFLDATNLTTNGSDVTLVFNAAGILRVNN
jgi:hypothetical protein